MKLVFHASPRRHPGAVLVILLPGFNFGHDDFVLHGFIEALHRDPVGIDVLVAEPDLDLYLDGTIGRHLADLVGQEPARHYSRIWFGGVSLGCLGALLGTMAYRGTIEGVILLSSFLGSPGLVAEVERAGGLMAWEPGKIAGNDGERLALAWLRSHTRTEPDRPILQLGYGQSDRFAAAAVLLAACLPPRCVSVVDGGHDWPTWTLLWRDILAAQPFAAAEGGIP